ncbi:hypothetical protein DFH07DRAFT_973558 [Mycena maculata]|uniref:Uncharacterized protein n=1 Tax=Mycena maculata TaxID=230809 RepID=A0AAD7MHT0_9AGAR|nr:hypothetical protein DFH07DRAFT_973558 [Mycena maculata]
MSSAIQISDNDDDDETPPPVPFVHDWAAPGVRTLPVPPPSHNGYPKVKPQPLHCLRFTPLGIYDLRRHMGVFAHSPSIWNTYHHRFEQADVAWLATGASSDNQHHPPHDAGFFPEFLALRESLPLNENGGYLPRIAFGDLVRKVLFDVATMLDRILGSTTLIIHSEGTTRPNSLMRPEYLSSTVYIPPTFLAQESGRSHSYCAYRPALYRDCRRPYGNWRGVPMPDASLSGRLNQSGPPRSPNYIPPGLVIPDPKERGSSVYVFRGRPDGSLNPPSPAPAVPAVPAPSEPVASQTSTRYGSEGPEEYSQDALNLIAEIEHNHVLMQDIADLRSHVTELEDALDNVQALMANRDGEHADVQRRLEQTISSLQLQLHRAQVSSPSTSRVPSARPPSYVSSSSQLLTPTKTRSTLTPRSPRTTSPIKGEVPLPLTTACLSANSASAHMPAIRLMVKHVASTKWYEELEGLGFKADLVQALLDSLTSDMSL